MKDYSKDVEKRTIKKVTMRLIPFLFILYIISYLDRANIGYAALDMNADLGITSEVFGFISGIFFIGYFLFEVPSNILLQRYGSRVWIARILITWGIVSVATAFAQEASHLYIIRFLLGVAEAGFFPGIILYLNFWFRKKELARTIAMFMTAIPVSYIIGGPLSTWIMDNIEWLGVSGWRWMFILEGSPAVILGIVTYFYLTNKPEEAKWLSKEEKTWLIEELRKDKEEHEGKKEVQEKDHKKALTDKKVWHLAIIYFVYISGSLGVGYWMPQIIKELSSFLSNTQIGLISTIPFIVATIAMNYWAVRSDRTGERKMHSAIPLVIGALALIGAGLTSNPFLSMFFLTLSLAGMYCFKGPFFALPSMLLTPSTTVVGIAVINSIGNLGGFLGPYAVGMLKDSTGSTGAGLIFLSAMLLIGFVLVLFIKNSSAQAKSTSQKIIKKTV
ncbi:MFS transporter [Domibacillus sp. DTU_2020_1001157_1_SI_ALB_TIR_016]|uniref:MFS transporter n=1 Tax=Domibacillus sp. DTU_2020_1001157_1_SI_ALB_TIR_016 TaxID=3077789 RepID=UPI0028E2084F|nr:MFS transporter [Domibacillus sp. DTU_2020_1001157_1_SI_ALB_TIR_016]WNS79568.1 MFS transporter [Domibacillus sp. DTU_2020_1001157_1_SI_ALB_TIR_016]